MTDELDRLPKELRLIADEIAAMKAEQLAICLRLGFSQGQLYIRNA